MDETDIAISIPSYLTIHPIHEYKFLPLPTPPHSLNILVAITITTTTTIARDWRRQQTWHIGAITMPC